MRKISILSVLLATIAGMSMASETMPIPENCQATVTFHRDSCVVSNYILCGDRTEIHLESVLRMRDREIDGHC